MMEAMRILIVRSGALGDTLVAEPLVRSCRAAAGTGGEVVLLGTMPQAKLVGAGTALDVNALNIGGLFGGGGDVDDRAWAALSGFDVAISFWASGWDEFASNIEAIGCSRSIGMAAFPEADSGVHVVDHCLEGARQARIEPVSRAPQVTVMAEWRESARQLLSEAGARSGPVLVVHPGSGSRAKCWPVEAFAEVARECESRLGLQTVMVAGPADDDSADGFCAAYGASLATIRMAPVEHIAGILSLAKGFIGNDSGVSHLAAAVGTKTVSVFVNSDAAIWSPRGDAAKVIEAKDVEADVADAVAAMAELAS